MRFLKALTSTVFVILLLVTMILLGGSVGEGLGRMTLPKPFWFFWSMLGLYAVTMFLAAIWYILERRQRATAEGTKTPSMPRPRHE